MSNEQRRANRLAQETSPYLLQHAYNPVDWYPWCNEALDRARKEDRPIFLSIGYSACHWCHVMERESFEDPRIAQVLNDNWVSIKVDREERPDLDEIYMRAVQALNEGQGGWPMSVFLTPGLEPFFGGTYFPPTTRFGRPGFDQVLERLLHAWHEQRGAVVAQAARLREMIEKQGAVNVAATLADDVLDRSLRALKGSYDATWGGFGDAPKFPHSQDVRILLRHARRTGSSEPLEMAVHTLRRMARGGIYDHLAGGFARYSTDEKWLVPHFEKMLYDNALLVPAYLEAAAALGGDDELETTARETCDWMLREMTTPEGGLASSVDADSEGVEGKFYVWNEAELEAALGPADARRAAVWFDVTAEGNFEGGRSVLWRPRPAEECAEELGVPADELAARMDELRPMLREARDERVRPGLDDKVLASWNGLAITALARAYQGLGDARYLDAARGAARYVLESMRQPDGRLFATARGGRAHLNAYLDDYAFLVQALVDLYESDFDPHWLREADALDEIVRERFEDEQGGGWYTTASDHEQLIARLKTPHDGALPSGSGVYVLNLLRLGALLGRDDMRARAERALRSVGRLANQHTAAMSQTLMAVDFLRGSRELVVAGALGDAATDAFLGEIRGRFLPDCVVALADDRADPSLVPVVEGRSGTPRAFVCRDRSCGLPAEDAAQLASQLDAGA